MPQKEEGPIFKPLSKLRLIICPGSALVNKRLCLLLLLLVDALISFSIAKVSPLNT